MVPLSQPRGLGLPLTLSINLAVSPSASGRGVGRGRPVAGVRVPLSPQTTRGTYVDDDGPVEPPGNPRSWVAADFDHELGRFTFLHLANLRQQVEHWSLHVRCLLLRTIQRPVYNTQRHMHDHHYHLFQNINIKSTVSIY